MKIFELKSFLALLLMIVCAMPIFSQKVYKVDYESQADIKVYIVDYESQADLCVYYVDYESQANKPGL